MQSFLSSFRYSDEYRQEAPVILIALGGNLSHEVFGTPRKVIGAALAALEAEGVRVAGRSRFYDSVPVPASEQPNFVNAAASIEVGLGPRELMQLLQRVEAAFGRVRRTRNEARTLDLDLLAYDDRVRGEADLVVPHPRLHERAFVLLPLRDVAPGWRHPRLGKTVEELIAVLPDAALQGTRAIAESARP
jgi:2-amino-4-hydroxy-6-hydroxymethyldihydropteridine diphosphokinase